MILRYRVSLPGIKGFARVYEINDSTSLYDFHKRMRDDMSFGRDQLILFKALDLDGDVLARYGMFDLGDGTIDEITLRQTVDRGVAQFTYFYDATNKKSVIVTFEGEVDPAPGRVYPALVEIKGPDPIEFENGYVAYEDLPEDQKHHPGEAPKPFPKDDKDIDDLDLSDDDLDDEDLDDDDDGDDEESSDDEDGQIIYDGSEDLNF